MNSILDKMSLSDLILLKSKLEEKLLQKEQWVNGMRGWDDINKFNQRFYEFKEDPDHERIKIVNKKIDEIVNFPLPFKSDSDSSSKDLVINEGYNKAKNSDYNFRKVLSDLDNDIYYSGWMDCYDYIKKNT